MAPVYFCCTIMRFRYSDSPCKWIPKLFRYIKNMKFSRLSFRSRDMIHPVPLLRESFETEEDIEPPSLAEILSTAFCPRFFSPVKSSFQHFRAPFIHCFQNNVQDSSRSALYASLMYSLFSPVCATAIDYFFF